MRSTITERGQTVIPAPIRRQFGLTPAEKLEWIVESGTIRVVPVRSDPVHAFRGSGAGGGASRLVEDRRLERQAEARAMAAAPASGKAAKR
jgi:AbrB family looped-hinge helix DNA binding protein